MEIITDTVKTIIAKAMVMKNKVDFSKLNLVDCHSHFIHEVDDGSTSLEASLNMIDEEINSGVTSIICTPHYRSGMFEASNEVININFNILKEEVNKKYPNVNLYLGREIYVHSMEGSVRRLLDRISTGFVRGINDTNNYLLEFSYTKEIDISEVSYALASKGYQPIIAHIERYQYIDDINKVEDIKNTRALIQVNASCILGKDVNRKKQRFILKLIKLGLVDMVASDIHEYRKNYMKEAFLFVYEKFGENVALDLFKNNPSRLLN